MPAPPTTNKNNSGDLSTSMSGATATETHWFLLSPKEVAVRLETSLDEGLSQNEVESRHRRDGPNELTGGGGVSILSILAGQVCSTSSRFCGLDFF
jgi:Na+-exporting ATPase